VKRREAKRRGALRRPCNDDSGIATSARWPSAPCGPRFGAGGRQMTKKAQRKLRMKMKQAWRKAVQARKKHKRAVAMYSKLQKKFRAA